MKASILILIFFCFVLIADTPEVKGNWSMDIGAVITTAITTIGLIVVAWIGFKVAKLNSKVDKYHTEVNGKMEKLLEVTKAAGKAEGNIEGRKAEQEETDAKKQKEGMK